LNTCLKNKWDIKNIKINEYIKKIIQWDKFVGIYMIEHSMFDYDRVLT